MKANSKKMTAEISSALAAATLVNTTAKKMMKKIDVTAKKKAKIITKKMDASAKKSKKDIIKKEQKQTTTAKKVVPKKHIAPAVPSN